MSHLTLKSKPVFKPREYQEPILESIIAHCKKKDAKPAFVDMSVGAGKTAIYAFIANHVASKGGKVMVLARQGELVEQNSAFCWKAGFKNSIYSASLKQKSKKYNIVYASEGTVARQIGEGGDFGYSQCQVTGKTTANWCPDLLMVDECLTSSTLIKTTKGNFSIGYLAKTNSIHTGIYCVNEDTGDICVDNPVRIFSNGTRNISRVKFNGGQLECTNTHKLYSGTSWVRVKNLKTGQMITLDGSQDIVIKKLIRAVAAVVKKLILTAERKT